MTPAAAAPDPRYPVGRFVPPSEGEPVAPLIDVIAALPSDLAALVSDRGSSGLEKTYRAGGWNVRQLVHHLADSHGNAFFRFKLALTEDNPTVKPYREDLWAELPDTREAPAEPSLAMLAAVHQRWVLLMRAMTPEQWQRGFVHPQLGTRSLAQTAALYAWHGRHHLAHVKIALQT